MYLARQGGRNIVLPEVSRALDSSSGLPAGHSTHWSLPWGAGATVGHYKTEPGIGKMHADGQQLHVMTADTCVHAA